MKEIVIPPSVTIPVAEYAIQGNAVLGIRDSGKTFTATWIAEQLIASDVPFIVFDPIGIWRSLQIPGNFKGGKGFDVVVAGDDADLPLDPHSAPEIVRAAMRENISLIVDLFSPRLSKADWRRIVGESVTILLFENKRYGARHIFIEEATEFVPQRLLSDQMLVYSVFEKLARMGGNSGLGFTLINQRPEEINKAVLELCDCLFLHRQKGRHSITALSKWLDVASADNRSEVVQSLPTLAQGECWIWSQGSTNPRRGKIPAKLSHHPDRRNPTISARSKTVDVSAFVDRLKSVLPKAEPAPESKKGLSRKKSKDEPSHRLAQIEAHRAAVVAHSSTTRKRALAVCEKIGGALQSAEALFEQLREILNQPPPELALPRSEPLDVVHDELRPTPIRRGSPRISSDGENHAGFGKAENSILAILARHHPEPLEKRQLALMAGYSWKGGGFANALSKLRTNNCIEGSGTIGITARGISCAPALEPLPEGSALADWWIRDLGRAEASILRVLTTPPRRQFDKFTLAAQSGYEASGGGFANALSKLRTLGLISKAGRPIEADSSLFD